MKAFTDSCIAKDFHGKPMIFRRGEKFRLHSKDCPQTDGMVVTIDCCFYQDTCLAERGLAVLLNELSWVFCNTLEAV